MTYEVKYTQDGTCYECQVTGAEAGTIQKIVNWLDSAEKLTQGLRELKKAKVSRKDVYLLVQKAFIAKHGKTAGTKAYKASYNSLKTLVCRVWKDKAPKTRKVTVSTVTTSVTATLAKMTVAQQRAVLNRLADKFGMIIIDAQ